MSKAAKTTASPDAGNSPKKKRNTAHLKQYQWKKGCASPNPHGRPKGKPIRDAILRRMVKKLTPKQAKGFRLKYGEKWADAVADWLIREVLLKSNLEAYDRLKVGSDGLEVQEISGPDGGAIPFTLDEDDGSADEQLKTVTERIRARIRQRREADTSKS